MTLMSANPNIEIVLADDFARWPKPDLESDRSRCRWRALDILDSYHERGMTTLEAKGS
jgi:hypothetical protein